jgi:hypothetical protein
VIKQKIYPLPQIQDILSPEKVIFSMQYCTFELPGFAKELCVIITPHGNYQYNRAPMSVKQFPDFAQEVMADIFHQGCTYYNTQPSS